MSGALVLLSGGQDSATCLAWALTQYAPVETIGFDYGQRHRSELEARTRVLHGFRNKFPEWACRLGTDHVLDLGILGQISESALTRDCDIATTGNGLPNTFVPGRNIIFLTFAAALAYRRNLTHIVSGVCETDYSGYPDCRDDTIKALQVVLNLGMEKRFVLDTPLMWIDKAETWRLADRLGGSDLVELIRSQTLSCYKGDTQHVHAWGLGCGDCPACNLRAKGYAAFTARSPQ